MVKIKIDGSNLEEEFCPKPSKMRRLSLVRESQLFYLGTISKPFESGCLPENSHSLGPCEYRPFQEFLGPIRLCPEKQ